MGLGWPSLHTQRSAWAVSETLELAAVLFTAFKGSGIFTTMYVGHLAGVSPMGCVGRSPIGRDDATIRTEGSEWSEPRHWGTCSTLSCEERGEDILHYGTCT